MNRLTTVGAALAVVVLLLSSTAVSSATGPSARIERVRPALSYQAKRTTGDSFGCLNEGAKGLYLLVTSNKARRQGVRIVRKLHATDTVTVRRIPSRFSLKARQARQALLIANVPAAARSGLGTIALSGPVAREDAGRQCSPVAIDVSPGSPANAWAMTQRQKYGPDRVVVRLLL